MATEKDIIEMQYAGKIIDLIAEKIVKTMSIQTANGIFELLKGKKVIKGINIKLAEKVIEEAREKVKAIAFNDEWDLLESIEDL